MTVDMFSASLLLPAPAPSPGLSRGAPGAGEAEADAAARAEGFWAAVLRHLWHPADAAPPPRTLLGARLP